MLVVTHSDVCSWYRETRAEDAPECWAAYARVVEAGLRSADFVTAPTEYQASRIRRHYGRAVDRIVPNGVEPPQLPAGGGRERPRTRILTVGRAWDEAKGIELLDEALGRLGDAAPEVDLVGAVRHSERHVRHLDNLRVHGPLDRAGLCALYRETRLYVGASLYEPFGLAPAEAASHGCALLLSGIGSFRELWRDCRRLLPSGRPCGPGRAAPGGARWATGSDCERLGRRPPTGCAPASPRPAWRVRTRRSTRY